jgi:hypothetical protein
MPKRIQQKETKNQGIHVMTRVKYSLATWLNANFVLALVQRRVLLAKGCSLKVCVPKSNTHISL